MEGRISMSEKELYRLQILKEVEEKKMLVDKAAKILKISIIQLSGIRKSFEQKYFKVLVYKSLVAFGDHKIAEE